MLKPLSLRKNFVWTFIGNLANAVCQWGVAVVIVKAASAELLGLYAWAMAISTPIVNLSMLQLRPLLITDVENKLVLGQYFSVRTVTMVIAMCVIAIIAMTQATNSDAVWALILFGLSRCIDAFGDLFRAGYQRFEQMQFCTISLAGRGFVGLFAVGGTLLLGQSLPMAMATLCIAWATLMFVVELPLLLYLARHQHAPWVRFKFSVGWPALRGLLIDAVPLGFVVGLLALQVSIPRIILERYHGFEAVGYFSGLVYPMQAGLLVVTAIGVAALPRLSKLWQYAEPQCYLKLLGKIVGLAAGWSLLMLLAVYLFGTRFLQIFYDASFAIYRDEFLVTAIGGSFLFLGSILGYALTSSRQFKSQLLMAILSCASGYGVGQWMIPTYGVYGAAIAYMVSSAIALLLLVAMQCFAINKRWRKAQSAKGNQQMADDLGAGE